jgi:hypothetical protein
VIGIRQPTDHDIGLLERHPAQPGGQRLVAVEPKAPGPAAPAGRAALLAGAGERYAQADRGRCGQGDRERRDNGAMTSLPSAPWWTVRRATNRKPSTYRCPICGHLLPALSEHMLIAPEGDTRRRRHAHTACVLDARRTGALRLRDEWRSQQPRGEPWWRRLLRRS